MSLATVLKASISLATVLAASMASTIGLGPVRAAAAAAAATAPAATTAINVNTLTCFKYQNEVLAAPAADPPAAAAVPRSAAAAPPVDAINTVMWLFGYSVGNSGAHVMYGDALAGFGFALDAECKSNPSEILMNALVKVKPSDKNPMDLATLDCMTFSSRHVDLARTDAESADTIMMWLYGFASAKSGSHVLDAARLPMFETTFLGECSKHPEKSVFDTLSMLKF